MLPKVSELRLNIAGVEVDDDGPAREQIVAHGIKLRTVISGPPSHSSPTSGESEGMRLASIALATWRSPTL